MIVGTVTNAAHSVEGPCKFLGKVILVAVEGPCTFVGNVLLAAARVVGVFGKPYKNIFLNT